jgi:NADH dehydrogenase FAD-containing subunit
MSSPHKDFIKNILVIKDEVTELTETTIKLSKGKTITNFDFVVVATGSEYDISKQIDVKEAEIPIVRGNSFEDVLKHNDQFLKSDNITVIGSGSVGIGYLIFNLNYIKNRNCRSCNHEISRKKTYNYFRSKSIFRKVSEKRE